MQIFKKYGIAVFLALLVLHCGFILIGENMGRIITKLLLVPVLMIYLYASLPRNKVKPSPVPVFIALFFSFLGDLFLTQAGTNFFLLGMVGFIVTHICNSIYFLKLQPFRLSKPWPSLIAFVIIGTAIWFVFGLMKDNLGAFTVPILVYMALIAVMGILAANVTGSETYRSVAIRFLIRGAALFILSDAMLALDKFHFYRPEVFNIPVMVTYGVAQLFLVLGFERSFIATESQKH